MYLYKRGKGSKNRVVHLAEYDRLGKITGALCNTSLQLNTSCNMPLGQPVCKKCLAEYKKVKS